MTHALTPTHAAALAIIGQLANDAAARHVFEDYRQRKAANTLRRQRDDLALFAEYLAAVQVTATADALQSDANAWQGVTWGLVAGFREWMLRAGYAIGSVNVRLSTVKTYVKLAFKAGAVTSEQYALIRAVEGYQHKETKRVDEKRAGAGVATRKGVKKAEAVSIPDAVRRALKTGQPDTKQGRRDALLCCLLLDHGLRCGEIAALQVTAVDLKAGELHFYRPKVNAVQTHKLTPDTLRAVKAWFASGDAPAAGALLRGSNKGGALTTAGMSTRAITKRIHVLGEQIGITGLSAHDGRHSWATTAARKGTDPFALQEAGGWNSLAMPRRYVEAAKIANEGVKLD